MLGCARVLRARMDVLGCVDENDCNSNTLSCRYTRQTHDTHCVPSVIIGMNHSLSKMDNACDVVTKDSRVAALWATNTWAFGSNTCTSPGIGPSRNHLMDSLLGKYSSPRA